MIGKLILRAAAAGLALTLAGCSSPEVVSPVGGGYQEVAHSSRFAASPADIRISFRYRAPDGKNYLVWPSLYGVAEVVHGDLAVFVGEVAYVSSDPDNPRGMKPRLFVVQAPGLPVDITNPVLAQWAKASGKDFARAQELFSLATPVAREGGLEVQLDFWTQARDWPDKSALQLNWNQVAELMRAARQKGSVRKDLRWKMPYIAG